MRQLDLITTREAAALLGVSRQHVARLVRSGQLAPAHRAPGPRGALAFQREEVERLWRERAGLAV